MAKTLVVTEKPSVAQTLAAVLGANKRGDGFLEGGEWLILWTGITAGDFHIHGAFAGRAVMPRRDYLLAAGAIIVIPAQNAGKPAITDSSFFSKIHNEHTSNFLICSF